LRIQLAELLEDLLAATHDDQPVMDDCNPHQLTP
jgi:hypothetical protein